MWNMMKITSGIEFSCAPSALKECLLLFALGYTQCKDMSALQADNFVKEGILPEGLPAEGRGSKT